MADTKNANKNKATKARQLARRVSSDEEHPLLRHAGPSSLYEQIAELEAEVHRKKVENERLKKELEKLQETAHVDVKRQTEEFEEKIDKNDSYWSQFMNAFVVKTKATRRRKKRWATAPIATPAKSGSSSEKSTTQIMKKKKPQAASTSWLPSSYAVEDDLIPEVKVIDNVNDGTLDDLLDEPPLFCGLLDSNIYCCGVMTTTTSGTTDGILDPATNSDLVPAGGPPATATATTTTPGKKLHQKKYSSPEDVVSELKDSITPTILSS